MTTPVNDRSLRLLAETPRIQTVASLRLSIAAALEDATWAGAPLVAVADGAAGGYVRRSIAGTPTTLSHPQLIAIENGRRYRFRFWARASADANGTMSADLQQYLAYDLGQPGPTNSGRSPFIPNAVAKHTDWRLYDSIWDVTSWQAGAKYFRPDFALNTGGTAGYWEVQGFSLVDATDTLLASDNAAEALSTAGQAKISAEIANAELTNIANDNKLSKGEKGAVKADYDAITDEKNRIITQATSLNVSTTAYANAYSGLNAYMAALSPAYTDFTQDTTISGDTFRSYFGTYYTEKVKILNAIAAESALRAQWTYIAGQANAPANNATVGAPSGTYVNGVLAETLTADAATAKSNAAQALINAALANTAITDIGRDDVLSPGEKPEANAKWNAIQNEYTANYNQGTAFGLTTLRDQYQATVASLTNYISTLQPQFATIPGTAISINGATFRSMFQAYYDARQGLLNAIDTEASKRATWGTVAGRPSNIASLSGNESINNALISLGADGVLSGGGGGSGVTLSGIGLKNYRAVASGGASTSTPISPGLYLNGVLALAPSSRGFVVGVISRSTGLLTVGQTFDVYGSGAATGGRSWTEMANFLNAQTSSSIVVVISTDESKNNRTAGALPAAMYRCGASRVVFGSPAYMYRAAYILIGIPGCGEGAGAEGYQGAIENDPNAWCDLGFSVVNGNLSGISSSYTPKTLADYSYTGSLNATSDLILLSANMAVSGNNAIKTAGGDDWNASIYSKTNYQGAAFCEFTVDQTNTSYMMGLTAIGSPGNSSSYPDIGYAIHLAGGQALIYQYGSQIGGPYGNYAVGDVFQVAIDGLTCKFYKNGVQFGATQQITNPNLVLYLDSSFQTPGGSVSNIKFGPLTNKYITPRATPDNLIPDSQFRDLIWWHRPAAGVSQWGDQGVQTPWKSGASMYIYPGPLTDTFTESFPQTPGATYLYEFQASPSSDFQGAAGIYWFSVDESWNIPPNCDNRGTWNHGPANGLMMQWTTGSPIGIRTYAGKFTLSQGTNIRNFLGQIRITTEITAGNLEIGSFSITRVTDAALLANNAVTATAIAPGAVDDDKLGLAAFTINGLSDYNGGAGRPAVNVGVQTASCANGKAPYSFSWGMERVDVSEEDTINVTMIVTSVNYPNDTCQLKGFQFTPDANHEYGKVTCTATDANGRSATRIVNYYVD